MGYTDIELIEKFKLALQKLWEEPGNLLGRSVHERTVTACLALHLKNSFPEHSVDCEYNRNFNNPKEIDKKRVVPDIIVHKRLSNKDNLLVVEVKFTSDQRGREKDHKKLSGFTHPNKAYHFQLGLFVELNERTATLLQFKDGKKQEPSETVNRTYNVINPRRKAT